MSIPVEFDLDGSTVVVERCPPPVEMTIVECKGWGHPDTLADHLAERLSRAYGRYTQREFGAVLHHNFDKLALLGGLSEVRYGSGRMLVPVRVLVNGRAARSCGGVSIPVDDLITHEVTAFFHERLPELDGMLSIEVNVTTNPSPGAVVTDKGIPERNRWFAPTSPDDLRERVVGTLANDTSLGTGWAPSNRVEAFVRMLTAHLSGPDGFRARHLWCGSDVKVMACGGREDLDVVLAVPQKCAHVPTRTAYLANKEAVLAECEQLARRDLPGTRTRFRVNVRDLPDRDELYMTYTGSSIESGDEGVVGRGNRVNGLITPLRPMNAEGASGKNPVYHVGKLYNVAANRIAEQLHEATGAYPLQDLHILPQPAVLSAKLGQLGPLRAGQAAVLTSARIPLGLLDPLTHRRLGQIEVPGDLPDRPITALTQLNDLGLELRRERPTRPGPLPPHALHNRTSFPGRTPNDGCPSKRARPTRSVELFGNTNPPRPVARTACAAQAMGC